MDRVAREKKVIGQMIAIYCHKHHSMHGDEVCPDCLALLDYARQRLDRCPKGVHKSSCRKCEIHCYAPIYRHKIREVMCYVGPRMIFIHPWSALRHLWNER